MPKARLATTVPSAILTGVSPDPSGAPRVGIVGAGQLARMTYQAAIPLGLAPVLLAASSDDGAARIAHDVRMGAPTSFEALASLAAECEVVTFDHELVEAGQVARLEAGGRRFCPSSPVVALVQDKRRQRERLGALGLPSPPWRPVATSGDLLAFGGEYGWPIVAKARRGGYDGRGVWILDDGPAAERLFAEASSAGTELLVEAFVSIEREVAILVARRPSGDTRVYPLVETLQIEGLCREVLAPARLSPELAAAARDLALTIAETCGVEGILAVELFVAEGCLLVNELAARPHNSGHYSIEGCLTSQFENHLRAILDWPLGPTELVAPAVATVNVLGGPAAGRLHASLPRALAVEGAHVHLYGKVARPGRKLGHVTVLGSDPDDALARARCAAALLVEPARTEVGR